MPRDVMCTRAHTPAHTCSPRSVWTQVLTLFFSSAEKEDTWGLQTDMHLTCVYLVGLSQTPPSPGGRRKHLRSAVLGSGGPCWCKRPAREHETSGLC